MLGRRSDERTHLNNIEEILYSLYLTENIFHLSHMIKLFIIYSENDCCIFRESQ
jgi:hypothetical protein